MQADKDSARERQLAMERFAAREAELTGNIDGNADQTYWPVMTPFYWTFHRVSH